LGGSADIFASLIKSLDVGIGRVLNALDEEKLSGNKFVIFTNDNGGERYSDNGGLTDSKGSLWEGGIRVPAFVRWPGKIKEGQLTQQAAITMDWTATILAAAGAKPDNAFPLDGINLLPVLTGQKKSIDRTFYWRATQRTQQQAIRRGHWKYLRDEKGEYLFNLADDPGEKKDLKNNNQPILTELKSSLSAWEKSLLPPVPLTGSNKDKK
jgi:arylsulfatase A-like enzyme